MIRWSPIAWSRAGLAVALGAGLAACGPAAAPAGTDAAPPPPTSHTATAPAAGGEAGSGEAGEAGAVAALAGLSAEQTVAFNRWRLAGFVAIAALEAKDGRTAEASALLGQGVLEVFAAPADGVDLAPIKALDAELAAGPKPGVAERLTAAATALTGQAPPSADTVRRLLELAAGLYREADQSTGVDPLEYQHSLGAVLAAQGAFDGLKSKGGDAAALARAQAELTKLRALYAPVRAPDKITPHGAITAQVSRVELELAGL